MKWEGERHSQHCAISDCFTATVAGVPCKESWSAEVVAGGSIVWGYYGHPSESAAKAAVASWIGKTIAQLGNSLAAGEPRTFDDDGA